MLSNAALVLIGADVYTVPSFFEVRYFTLGTIVVNSMQFMLLGCAVILMLALTLFINKTKFGRAIRATSENMDVTSLMGINTNTIISLTFFIGAALAGAAGMLVGIYYDAVYSTMGYMAGMKAFTAAILGGIGLDSRARCLEVSCSVRSKASARPTFPPAWVQQFPLPF